MRVSGDGDCGFDPRWQQIIFQFFILLLIRRTIIKFRSHRGFNTESSSPESPVSTTAVHCHNMKREMVIYKSVWTQRQKGSAIWNINDWVTIEDIGGSKGFRGICALRAPFSSSICFVQAFLAFLTCLSRVFPSEVVFCLSFDFLL